MNDVASVNKLLSDGLDCFISAFEWYQPDDLLEGLAHDCESQDGTKSSVTFTVSVEGVPTKIATYRTVKVQAHSSPADFTKLVEPSLADLEWALTDYPALRFVLSAAADTNVFDMYMIDIDVQATDTSLDIHIVRKVNDIYSHQVLSLYLDKAADVLKAAMPE